MHLTTGTFMRNGLLLFAAILSFTACKPSGGEEGGNTEEADQEYLAAQDAEEAAAAAETTWQYETSTNAMGATNNIAVIKSLGEINLEFPYNGPQKGTLRVRHHSEYGKDLLFSVEQGQIQGDAVTIRFDEDKAFATPYTKPSDGSSELIFLDYDRLIGPLQKAKKVAMQVTFYDNGNQIFEFDVSGLDLTKL